MSLPTNEEQELLEWVNRLRMDPGGEFDRLIVDAATQTGINPGITSALRFFNVDLALFRTQMQALTAVAPLAWNAQLGDSAAAHSAAMITADTQAHQVTGEASLGTRILAAGYSFASVGENIYAFASTIPFGHAGFVVDWGFGTGGMQTPAGHRNNLMNATFTEIGIDVTPESNPSTQVGPLVITQDLGTRFSYAPQVMGVVFADADSDDFYDAGEGQGGITVTLVGTAGTFTTTTWASGGYQLAVPQGAYTVTFSGGALSTAVTVNTTLAGVNRKIDLNTALPLTGGPPPPPAPDLAAASDSGSSSTDNITKVTTPVFTGTVQAGATVTLFDGATQIGTGTADGTGLWSIKSSTLAAGVHSITIKTTTAGSTSNASSPLTVTIDTAAITPGAPDLTGASDSGLSTGDNITKITTPTFTGKAEGGALVTLFDGATAIGSATAGALGAWVIKTSALADGKHSITAKITDAAGNASAGSAALSVTIDTAAPAAPTTPDMTAASDTGASAVDNRTSNKTPTFTGRGEGGAIVTIFDGLTAVGTGTVGALGNWAVKVSSLTEGTHGISARLTDAAGNVSVQSGVLAINIDTTPPAAPTVPDLVPASDTGFLPGDNVTSVTTPTFIGKAEAGARVTLFDGATAIGSGPVGGLGNWAITAPALAQGVHSITARVTDVAGNLGPASAALSVTIDTTAPVAPSTPDLAAASDDGSSATDNITTITTPTFTGKGEGGARVTLFDGATAIGSGTVGGLGNWAIKTSALSVGVHSITARITDMAGNQGPASAGLAVTIVAPPGLSEVIAAPLAETVSAAMIQASLDTTLPDDAQFAFLAASSDAGLRLTGNGFANTIAGGAGDDVLAGLGGADWLTGGAGADVFAYRAVGDSLPGLADTITDFDAKAGDLLDLSGIDANLLRDGQQALHQIGAAAFGGVAGELRTEVSGSGIVVQADINGDGVADFAVNLAGAQGVAFRL